MEFRLVVISRRHRRRCPPGIRQIVTRPRIPLCRSTDTPLIIIIITRGSAKKTDRPLAREIVSGTTVHRRRHHRRPYHCTDLISIERPNWRWSCAIALTWVLSEHIERRRAPMNRMRHLANQENEKTPLKSRKNIMARSCKLLRVVSLNTEKFAIRILQRYVTMTT